MVPVSWHPPSSRLPGTWHGAILVLIHLSRVLYIYIYVTLRIKSNMAGDIAGRTILAGPTWRPPPPSWRFSKPRRCISNTYHVLSCTSLKTIPTFTNYCTGTRQLILGAFIKTGILILSQAQELSAGLQDARALSLLGTWLKRSLWDRTSELDRIKGPFYSSGLLSCAAGCR